MAPRLVFAEAGTYPLVDEPLVGEFSGVVGAPGFWGLGLTAIGVPQL